MQWKCLLVFSLIVVIQSATISKKSIPVKVVYEKEYSHKNYIRNLNEKVQLSLEELKQIESRSVDNENLQVPPIELELAENLNQQKTIIKNIEEKIQLSPAELKCLDKPSENKITYNNALRNHNEKVQLSPDELGEAFKHLPIDDENIGALRLAAHVEPQNKDVYEKVKNIVYNGIQKLKSSATSSEITKYIPIDVWAKLDAQTDKFLEEIKLKYPLRQSNQNLLEQFQQFTNNFLSQFSGSNPANVSSDESQPSFPQNIINFFTGGLQQIQSGLSNLSGQNQQSSTVQNDPDVTTKAPNSNPIQGFVSSVQGVFSQLNPFNQGQGDKPSTQGEETTQPNGPLQSIQNAFNQFGETIGNLNPFNGQTQKPGTAGDEATTTGPVQVIQGIASQAGQVFNQLNPFQQSTTKGPDADPTKNPIQSAAENIGNQISEGIGGLAGTNNPLSGAAQQVSEALQGANNPLQAAQGVAEQVGEAITGNNPLQGENNPLQVVQGVAEQVGGAIVSNNPLQAAQGVAEQVGEALTNNNPLQALSSPTTSKESSEIKESAKEQVEVKEENKNEVNEIKVA